jgi:HK97 gp10 family phage protein
MSKTIKGLTKVLKDLEEFGKEGKMVIDIVAEVTSMDIVADAKAFAPKNNGKLAQSIAYTKIADADYKVVVNSPYGAYVEFGTGSKVQVPTELQGIASQFKGKKAGTFEQGLRAIKDWCKNKGIPESAAYPIFMSILEKGQEPQPYLYPAFIKGRKQYLKDLKTVLKKLTKKHG